MNTTQNHAPPFNKSASLAPQGKAKIKSRVERQLLSSDTKKLRLETAKPFKGSHTIEKPRASRTFDPAFSLPSNKHVENHHLSTTIQSHSPISSKQKSLRKSTKQKTVNTNLITDAVSACFQRSDQEPLLSGGFCDRLTITFGTKSLDTEDFSLAIHDARKGKKRLSAGHPHLARFTPEKPSPYQFNYRMRGAGGKKLAILQLAPKSTRAAYVRLELNPAALSETDMTDLTDLLAMLFGPDYQSLIGTGRITRLDASVDVKGRHVSDLIVYTICPQKNMYWMRTVPKEGGEIWKLGSQYIGAETSGRQTSLYDKARQLYEVKGVCPTEACTRIEVRFRPDKGSHSVKIADLLNAKNPLKPINLAYFPLETPGDDFLPFFLAGVREWGCNPALAKIKDKNKRRAIRLAISKQRVEWWQPEQIWDDVLKHIKSLNLFPNACFRRKVV